ncbi:MAG TPA: Npt1/Npt2 family nucleotide transporter [Myxococcota bacterium]|nr:Npt1/Npt2 family nucleotide transporter [Myxococcota bacterium]
MKNSRSLQKKRTGILYLTGFILIFGYAIARPTIDSMFLEHYTENDLPLAWLITAFSSLIVIIFYNRFNQKLSILSLYGGASIVCGVLLAGLIGAYVAGFIPAIFILYIWKELYMVVLMETYWSFADIVFSTSAARHTYGIAMAMSSLGGVFGNLLVGPLAHLIGTKMALSTLILLLALGAVIAFFSRSIGDEKPHNNAEKKVGLGLKTVWHSRYLVPLGFMICTVQILIGLIDYRFNAMLRENFVNTDMRTDVLGQIHAAVNVFGIAIQLCTAPILKLFGIGNALKSVPFILSLVILAFVAAPQFALMVAVKISSKALDYSLLRGVKEIIYIPLSRVEKTQGKGIIDIFIYRLARGFSSMLLLSLIALQMTAHVMEFSLILVFLWLFLAIIIARRYQALMMIKAGS